MNTGTTTVDFNRLWAEHAKDGVYRARPVLHWYLVTVTYRGQAQEHGWMLAETDRELIDYARDMGFGIDIEYLGVADMNAVTPEILSR